MALELMLATCVELSDAICDAESFVASIWLKAPIDMAAMVVVEIAAICAAVSVDLKSPRSAVSWVAENAAI